MSRFTVLATPRSFAQRDQAPIRLLEKNGCHVIRLPQNGCDLMEDLWKYIPLADGIIAGLEPYDASLLERAGQLKIISRYGVGYDKVDLQVARRLGIRVAITPGANGDSVADLAVALMLSAARNICPMNQAIREGLPNKPISGVEMWKKTLGVVGTGRIGKGVIQRASGFGMSILANDAYPDEEFLCTYGGSYVDLDTLFAQSDFITLHAPLTPETKNLVDERRLSLMKPSAILVNTARGGIVDEDALYCALKEKRIAAAALDATLEEPACRSNLAQLPNCILTPHAGAATAEAANNMGMMAAQNLLQVLNGEDCHNLV
ncbi:phosphoglycerate dehydrogenase [Lawsonibacter sp. LCP25S3_G6]|uniref:phosphoglycerate dehydrogenase n=1 Tax=unclassified Lawsonibacter TaxID=2617946 RepID=UPI003F9BE4AC